MRTTLVILLFGALGLWLGYHGHLRSAVNCRTSKGRAFSPKETPIHVLVNRCCENGIHAGMVLSPLSSGAHLRALMFSGLVDRTPDYMDKVSTNSATKR